MLLIGVTGCRGNETEKPKDETKTNEYGEKENEEDIQLVIEKMSSEETKNLKIGDRIDKIPDLDLLEQNGMAAVVEYQDTIYKEKDNKELEFVETMFSYTPVYEKNIETSKYERDVNGVKHISESTYKGVVICEIVGIYTEKNGKNSVEILAPDNNIYIFDMVNQENADSLSQMLIE